VLKVKVNVKGHVIRALSWILGMSYSVIDGLVNKQIAECGLRCISSSSSSATPAAAAAAVGHTTAASAAPQRG